LIRKFREAETALRSGAGSRVVSLFSGVDIERWMLKALMGLASAKAARTPEGEPIPWAPPPRWLRILFGDFAFPDTWGIYVRGTIGHQMMLDPSSISVAPLTTGDEISGCQVLFGGFEFALIARDVPSRRTGAVVDESIYRPCEIIFEDPPTGTVRSIYLAWTTKWKGEAVHVAWSPHLLKPG
jgi:hypothetical protein